MRDAAHMSNVDHDQGGHLLSLISIFNVHMEKM